MTKETALQSAALYAGAPSQVAHGLAGHLPCDAAREQVAGLAVHVPCRSNPGNPTSATITEVRQQTSNHSTTNDCNN